MTDQDIEARVRVTLQAPPELTLGQLIDYYALVAENAKHIHASVKQTHSQMN